ncbi:DUF924 family protein [Phaeovulum sp.]|uniref:DUF924 family protein n=1 Tax=Phaeovulum sp. TaxID=2934796 RepID=UPI0039E2F613
MSVNDVLAFWLETVGPSGWYKVNTALDNRIRTDFQPLWERVATLEWGGTARGALAQIVVADQFPRNMFRGDPRSFATDALARDLADAAITKGFDLDIDPPARQFFYLPFMHAEDMALQNRCIDLFDTRMPGDNQRHARAHAQAIARFGRFPWRNDALGRTSTPAEKAILKAGGYSAALAQTPTIDTGKKMV